MSLPGTHRAVVMYPPSFDVRVETLQTPKIEHPDDVIVKIKVAGLCGSDLHFYRGHIEFGNAFVSGHEFTGEVVALGASYDSNANNAGRPELYSTLRVGDKVVSPFTCSCGECHFCRLGFPSRCESCPLFEFGSPHFPGAQAQYVRVPTAGGTLFKIPPDHTTTADDVAQWKRLSDTSLLLLSDILPTGMFAVLQGLQHPNVLPMMTSKPFPLSSFAGTIAHSTQAVTQYTERLSPLTDEDKRLTIAVIGLGPVGLCAVVTLLDQLELNGCKEAHVVAIDFSESRQTKAAKIVEKLGGVPGGGVFKVASPTQAPKVISGWTNGIGCNVALEIVGHSDALTLAYDLIRPFGVIASVGAHQLEPIGITGRAMYNKNVSLAFGRCPVHAIFPFALELLLKRQDIFGGVGEETSLVDKVVGMDDATVKDSYAIFEKGLCGKVLFEPWK